MFIDPPPNTENIADLIDWCEKLQQRILQDDLFGSFAVDPGNILDGDEIAQDVTVTGAVLGDYAVASLSVDIEDLTLDAQVTAADTVTAVLVNNTGGTINLASLTVYIRVFKRVQ